jgi:zinc protease
MVAVGDLKAEPMIERLRRHFAEIPSRAAPVEPDPGDPMAAASSTVAMDTEEESSQVTLTVAAPHPIDRVPDSLAKRRDELVRGVAMEMLENRLAREFDRLKIAGSPPDGKAAEVVSGIGWLEVSASSNPRDADRVMRSLIRAWRSALAHEFHATEFAEARGDVRTSLRAHFLSRITDDAADLATRLADSVRTGRLVQFPEDELNRLQADLTTITRQECEVLLKAEWAVPPRFFLSGRVDPSKQASVSEVVTSAMGEPARKVMHGAATRVWNPEAAGPPGRVIRRQLDEGRGFLEAELDNRILVRLAPIPSLGGYVMVQVDAGYGDQSLPPGNAALGTAAEILCRWHPLEGWRQLELNAALAEDDVSGSFSVGWNSFQWSGGTDRSQIRRQLDLLAALVNRPGLAAMPRPWVPDAHARAWDEKVRDTFTRKTRETIRLQNGFDPRFEFYPEGLMKTDSTQVADWLLPMLAGERLCVSLAGDFEPEAALAAVAATFGTLPERPAWEEASRFPPPPLPDPGVTRVVMEKHGSVASVTLMFPLGPAGDASEELRRDLLEKVLQLRVVEVLREKRGDSYAPRAHRRMRADHGTEWLVIDVPCAEESTGEMSEVLRGLVRDFRDRGWTRDEFQRALRPMPHVASRLARHPLAVLINLQNPAHMPAARQLDPAALGAMEGAVRELARRALDLDAAVELQVDR